MPDAVTVVVGSQWGDEGKGKIVDLLSADAEICARFQGGSNAGHTVVNQHGTFKLSLVPSGIFNPACVCMLGAGTVVEPPSLLNEIAGIEQGGVPVNNLFISDRAHVVMPYHRVLDKLEDAARGPYRVDTTGRGIGPAYTDKYARVGITLADLLRPDALHEKLGILLTRHNAVLTKVYGADPFDLDTLLAQATAWGEQLAPRIIDTRPILRDAVRDGKRIVLEGQLSAMKDIDWGSYPFVTSSSPTAGGAAVGAGIPPRAIDRVIGVAKAYSSQVGTGPMPTELHDDLGSFLRERGGEFGTVTGRPRRVGWFDAVVTRYVAELNGMTHLALTKLDVLDTLPEIKLCVAYRYRDATVTDLPDAYVHERCEPVYETLPGWQESTQAARSLTDLPRNARAYLDRIVESMDVRLHSVGVGPHRDETIIVGE